MGRLIDADVLFKELNDKNIPWNRQINDIIMAQPTAYDVEKVVEELSSNSRFVDDINEHNIKCISCVIGQKTAIDIVKRGGVEHDKG